MENTLIKAAVERDSRFDGVFVVGISGKKSICRPSCTEQLRSPEEIRLFYSVEDSRIAGYSACRKCKPAITKSSRAELETVEEICNYIRRNPSGNLSLGALESHFGASRFSIQKSFMKIMGISPRKYVEECRIQMLKRKLKEGEKLPRVVYEVGYGSHSWAYESPSTKLGMTPAVYGKGGAGEIIKYLTSPSKLGYLLVAETDKGICSVSLSDSEDQLIGQLEREFPRARILRSEEARDRIESILDYFDGQLLSLPVDVKGTEFQKRVWAAICEIPYGETRSYGEIAEQVGIPKAYRAVANACAANPVPLIVPCHRVIRNDGDLGGYGLGVGRKRTLLEMERRNARKQ
jgi:AraC family transcriptional regulator of adaptative response/methylated-DNA-[protein]-cysteine methyltransferase